MEIQVLIVLACGYYTGMAYGIRVTHAVPVLEHADVTLTCTNSDIQEQEVNWWYSKSKEELASNHIYQFRGPNDQRGFHQWAGRTFAESFLELTIRNVTVEDTGYYHCELRGNTFHIARIGSDLHVLVPTSRVEIQPTNTTFIEGEEARFSCSANGKPDPYLRWTKGIESETRGPVQGQMVYLGPLSLSWVDNQKKVVCEAEQRHPLLKERTIESSVTLNVLYAPRVAIANKAGDRLNLTCTVDANPPPKYILLKKENETLLTSNKSETNTVSYTKQTAQLNDTGLYKCVAENLLGLNSAALRLTWNCDGNEDCELEERPVNMLPGADDDNRTFSFIGVGLGGLGVAILMVWAVLCLRRKKLEPRSREAGLVTPSGLELDGLVTPTPSTDDSGSADSDNATESVALIDMDDRPPMPLPRPKPRFPKYELPLDRLHIDMSCVIGRGAFAKVYKGTLMENGEEQTVAIKTIRENATEEETRLFYEEIGIVIDIGNHDGVLRMRGCCTTHNPARPLLVMEYMPYGDLLNFLEKCKEVRNGATCDDPMYHMEEKMKYQIGSQVAGGMQYICRQKYIHGDLAARNILVSKGQTIVVKIADFGLTADIYQKGYQRQDPDQLVPYKWISLERLLVNGRCTEKSDVWSFGILLYEVVTLGGPPYPSIHFAEILRERLNAGWRMEMPEDCSFFMYDCMKSCWKTKPVDRPTFSQLKDKFDNALLKFFCDYNTVRS